MNAFSFNVGLLSYISRYYGCHMMSHCLIRGGMSEHLNNQQEKAPPHFILFFGGSCRTYYPGPHPPQTLPPADYFDRMPA